MHNIDRSIRIQLKRPVKEVWIAAAGRRIDVNSFGKHQTKNTCWNESKLRRGQMFEQRMAQQYKKTVLTLFEMPEVLIVL